MIDLHTHTLFSDGALNPSELVRRAEDIGYKVIGLTDHVDASNIDFVLPRLIKVSQKLNKRVNVKVIPGIELTHVPPEDFLELVDYARKNGAALVVAHGETIVEPVKPGTNKAAIEAGVDILAHPGLITEDEVRLAASKNVYLEITARKGHCLGNGNVAKLALACGAKLVLNTDTHTPENLITREVANQVALGAGLTMDQIQSNLLKSTDELVQALLSRL